MPRARLKRKIRPEPPEIRRYAFLKAIAYFEGAWETCPRKMCRARKKCTGGPRGTFTRNRKQMTTSTIGATGNKQEARSAEGTTGTRQEPRRSEAPIGTKENTARNAEGETGTWISVPLCRQNASREWWAELETVL